MATQSTQAHRPTHLLNSNGLGVLDHRRAGRGTRALGGEDAKSARVREGRRTRPAKPTKQTRLARPTRPKGTTTNETSKIDE